MKKMMKICLAIATVAMLTPAAASAADKEYSLYGRTRAGLKQTTTKTGSADAITKLDMFVDGRIGHTVSIKGETWTTTATSHYNITEADGIGTTRDAYVQLAKEDLEIRLGRYYMTDVYAWGDYAGLADQNNDSGSGIAGDRINALRVKLPQVGLAVDLGLNNHESYNQTDIHARFDKEMGEIKLGASYHMRTQAIDDKNGGVKDSANDGYSANSLGLAVKYTMGEMAFLFGLDSTSIKTGGSDDALGKQLINLGFDMGLGDSAGVSVTVALNTTDKDKDTKNSATNFGVDYSAPLGGATLNAGVWSKTNKDDSDGAEANTETGVGVRLAFGF